MPAPACSSKFLYWLLATLRGESGAPALLSEQQKKVEVRCAQISISAEQDEKLVGPAAATTALQLVVSAPQPITPQIMPFLNQSAKAGGVL